MFPVAVPAVVMPAVEPMPRVPPELSVNVPVPVSVEVLPVMLKVAPLETVQFLPDARAMLNPPLLSFPLWMLRFPKMSPEAAVALNVAPLVLVLLTFRLL